MSDSAVSSIADVLRWIGHHSDRGIWRKLVLAGLCALAFAFGTAALTFVVSPKLEVFAREHGHPEAYLYLLGFLLVAFSSRPFFYSWHVYFISDALRRLNCHPLPIPYTMIHQILVVMTRDIPMLSLLAVAMVVQHGWLTLLGIALIPAGLGLASILIKRHVKRTGDDHDDFEKFLKHRDARAKSEAVADLPQSIIVGGVLLWSITGGVSLSQGGFASAIVAIMLASPPLRRLVRLMALVATHSPGRDDEE